MSETKQATVCFIIPFCSEKNQFPCYRDRSFTEAKGCKPCPDHPGMSVPVSHFFGSLKVPESIQLLEGSAHRTEPFTVEQDISKFQLQKYNDQSTLFGNLKDRWVGNRIREGAQARILGHCHDKIRNGRPKSSPQKAPCKVHLLLASLSILEVGLLQT